MENEYLEKELKERGVDIDNTKEKVIELFETYLDTYMNHSIFTIK